MLRWLKKSEFAIDKEESGSHPIENPWFQYMYHFISLYLCLQRLAQKIVGTWNFPTSLTIPPMIAFTRLVLFAHSVLLAALGLLLLCWTRKVPRYQERCHGPSQFFWRPGSSLLLDRFCDFQWKKLSFAEGLQAHCWQTNVYILHSHAAKVAWNSFLPPPKRMNDDELQGENLAKWFWEKGSWRWVLDEIDALQDVSCFLYFYIFL